MNFAYKAPALSAASLGLVFSLAISANAQSTVTGSTPGTPVDPDNYNVFLDAGDDLDLKVTVTVPENPNKLDLFLLQDLSGSFVDDVRVVKAIAPDLVSELQSTVADVQFGVGSYIDKPVSPFGSTGNYSYRTDLALTSDGSQFTSTIDGLSADGGRDFPESQLEALLQTGVRSTTEIGFRSDALKVAVLTTDADFHVAGDFDSVPANNGDAVLDGTPPGTGEDYPSVEQVKTALMDAGIVPIFAVTTAVTSTYEGLVDDIGFGTVVTLERDSSNLIEAITTGLSEVLSDITLFAQSDDFGYVQSITPDGFSDVGAGESRMFEVSLLADGVADGDDTIELVAPGYGTTLVNVKVGGDTEPPASVPEPASLLGLLTLGVSSTLLKRKKQTVV